MSLARGLACSPALPFSSVARPADALNLRRRPRYRPRSGPARPPRPARRLAVGLRRAPGPPARDTAATWLPREDECAACHGEIADAWARSRHHAAFTNADFQRAYAREPTPFCRECHAPEHARLPASEADALGVGCLACHGGPATIVTGAARTGSEAPHGLRRDPSFATRTCARCHEFDFPEGSGRALAP
ncbi:multiheme c-type cytochrome [Nannocystis pusilla]|uniref:multiheme c-type cytochrome n=1 Tax=Nannocystis pusilla TaxID=889268 RepID=UPI003B7A81C7